MNPPSNPRETAFTALYRREYPDVIRFLRRRTDPDNADDIAHEAFLVAWRRFDDVPPRAEDARPWLFAVARNCLLNQRRTSGRRQALAIRLASMPAGVEPDPAESATARLDLDAAWSRLPPAQQGCWP
jgi:RNA polymerase sigma-70 factor (ECF subfamily)